MTKLEARLNRLEAKLESKPRVYQLVNWNTSKSDKAKLEKEIAKIQQKDPSAKIEILEAVWV